MATIDEIFSFLEKSQGLRRSELSADCDLCEDLGIDGDDFFELEEAFAREFDVDMSGYLWYFHHGEEGSNFGSLFFPAPNQRVDHVALTPAILLEAASRKRWPLTYAPHSLPSRRYDIVINRALVWLALAMAGLAALSRVMAWNCTAP